MYISKKQKIACFLEENCKFLKKKCRSAFFSDEKEVGFDSFSLNFISKSIKIGLLSFLENILVNTISFQNYRFSKLYDILIEFWIKSNEILTHVNKNMHFLNKNDIYVSFL